MVVMTTKFMGRNKLVSRLSAQVGSRSMAVGLLKKRGHMKEDGTLTAEGKKRNKMTAKERAVDRAVKLSGKSSTKYKYNPKTNAATLKNK